jgi:hypothetical protein
MAEQVAWAAGKRGIEDVLLCNEAHTAACSGRLGKAREFYGRDGDRKGSGQLRDRERAIAELLHNDAAGRITESLQNLVCGCCQFRHAWSFLYEITAQVLVLRPIVRLGLFRDSTGTIWGGRICVIKLQTVKLF